MLKVVARIAVREKVASKKRTSLRHVKSNVFDTVRADIGKFKMCFEAPALESSRKSRLAAGTHAPIEHVNGMNVSLKKCKKVSN